MYTNIDEIINTVADFNEDCTIVPKPVEKKKPKSKVNLSEFISKKAAPYLEFNRKKEAFQENSYDSLDIEYFQSKDEQPTLDTKPDDNLEFKENSKSLLNKAKEVITKTEIPLKETIVKNPPQISGK